MCIGGSPRFRVGSWVGGSGRTRPGPLRQLLVLGLVHATSNGFALLDKVPKYSVVRAAAVTSHGARAIDRRRRMAVRHALQRRGAVTRIGDRKRQTMHSAIASYLKDRGCPLQESGERASRAVARRCGKALSARVAEQRLEVFQQDVGSSRKVPVLSSEVFVPTGDRVLTGRARRAGGRPVSVRRRARWGDRRLYLERVGFIVGAREFAEHLRDRSDALSRCRQHFARIDDVRKLELQLAPPRGIV